MRSSFGDVLFDATYSTTNSCGACYIRNLYFFLLNKSSNVTIMLLMFDSQIFYVHIFF